MCCQPGVKQSTSKLHGIESKDCGCNSNVFPRRFYSSKEEKDMLEEYRDQLSQELAGVDEYIDAMKKK